MTFRQQLSFFRTDNSPLRVAAVVAAENSKSSLILGKYCGCFVVLIVTVICNGVFSGMAQAHFTLDIVVFQNILESYSTVNIAVQYINSFRINIILRQYNMVSQVLKNLLYLFASKLCFGRILTLLYVAKQLCSPVRL